MEQIIEKNDTLKETLTEIKEDDLINQLNNLQLEENKNEEFKLDDLYELINKPQFTKGIWIVLIISIAKLMELALGTGNAILVNSKYYKIFFYLSLAMAFSVIVLNKWLINLIGINGAALATLIVVIIYSIFKIIYIKAKLKIQPFSFNTIKILLVVFGIFMSFYFWDFSFHPIINIALKCIMIGLIYLVFINKLKVSKDINKIITKYL